MNVYKQHLHSGVLCRKICGAK